MDFKSYRENSNKKPVGNAASSDKKSEEIKNVIDEYSSRSEESLKQELAARYKKEVEEGRMSKERLNEITNVLNMYLDETQREKLGRIIDSLEK